MALGLSTSTFLFGNRNRYHGVLTMEVPQIQLSTPRWTFLFGNRDRYHDFSGSRQWRCLRFCFRQRDGHFCLATESVHASHLQRTTRGHGHFDQNVLESTEVSAVPAEVTLRLLRCSRCVHDSFRPTKQCPPLAERAR